MVGEKKKDFFSRISFDCVAFFMVFASLLTLICQMQLQTDHRRVSFKRCHSNTYKRYRILSDIQFYICKVFAQKRCLVREDVCPGIWFSSVWRVCVCRYILCQCGQPMGGYTNAQQYTCWWRGWHFKHRKVDLFIGESDISNVLKLHYSLKIIFGELQSALLCWNCIMAWAKLGHATIFGRN